MRNYVTSPHGDMFDLDNPKTFEYLPNVIKELRDLMFREVGYFYCYFNFWHKDFKRLQECGQRERVENLIKDFTENEKQHYEDIVWYKEQVFIFQDAIENLC